MEHFLDYLSSKYYEGNPVVSDSEFDRLSDAYGYNKVGHTITDGVPHLIRMYSLQKVFSDEDLKDFISRRDFISTPKFDLSLIHI